MVKKKTRQSIKSYLEGFIQGIINEKTSSNFGPEQLRPLLVIS